MAAAYGCKKMKPFLSGPLMPNQSEVENRDENLHQNT